MTIAIILMGGLGLVVGIGLAIASKVFYVYVDPKIVAIDDASTDGTLRVGRRRDLRAVDPQRKEGAAAGQFAIGGCGYYEIGQHGDDLVLAPSQHLPGLGHGVDQFKDPVHVLHLCGAIDELIVLIFHRLTISEDSGKQPTLL